MRIRRMLKEMFLTECNSTFIFFSLETVSLLPSDLVTIDKEMKYLLAPEIWKFVEIT